MNAIVSRSRSADSSEGVIFCIGDEDHACAVQGDTEREVKRSAGRRFIITVMTEAV